MDSEVQFAFGAIESGPLDFARSYSSVVAAAHLERVLSQKQISRRGFLGGEILLLAEPQETVAKWYGNEIYTIPVQCISEFTKVVQDSKDLYPYRMKLKLNSCGDSLLSSRIANASGLSILFTFATSLFGIFLFYLPILKSAELAFRAISDSAKEIPTEKISHPQIKMLFEEAIKAKEVRELNIIKEVSYRVAHDIRSPLSALISLSQLADELPEYKKNLLVNAVGRISSIAGELLQRKGVSNIRSLESIMVESLVEKVVAEKNLEVLGKNLSIEYISDVGCFALINPTNFQSLISNFINNSAEANARNICIRIAKGENIVILITDDGEGIPADLLSEIGKRPISSKESGYGIGLSSAFQFLKAWGGTLEVQSKIREGTTIKISLPLTNSLK